MNDDFEMSLSDVLFQPKVRVEFKELTQHGHIVLDVYAKGVSGEEARDSYLLKKGDSLTVSLPISLGRK